MGVGRDKSRESIVGSQESEADAPEEQNVGSDSNAVRKNFLCNSLVQKIRKDMRVGPQDFIRITEMCEHAV